MRKRFFLKKTEEDRLGALHGQEVNVFWVNQIGSGIGFIGYDVCSGNPQH